MAISEPWPALLLKEKGKTSCTNVRLGEDGLRLVTAVQGTTSD